MTTNDHLVAGTMTIAEVAAIITETETVAILAEVICNLVMFLLPLTCLWSQPGDVVTLPVWLE
jgi:uncharacterized membrane protein